MTVIIVEGCDLSGKTTAIEKIAKFFNSGFILKNSFKPKKVEEKDEIYLQYWSIYGLINSYSHKNKTIILDRFYPSQVVYSILRGEDELLEENADVWEELENYLVGEDYLLIYLDTPLKVLKDRFRKRGDEHITEDKIELIKTRYDRFFNLTKLQKLKINTESDNWLNEVENFIRGGKT